MTNKQLLAGARRVLEATIGEFEKFLDRTSPDLVPEYSRRTKIIHAMNALAHPSLTPSGESSGYLADIVNKYIEMYSRYEPELCSTSQSSNRPRVVGIISGYLTHLIKKGYVGRKHGVYYLTYAGKALPYT